MTHHFWEHEHAVKITAAAVPDKPESRNVVYVVVWDDARIVKAGYTTGKRWRKFEGRGARLVALYDHGTDQGAAFAHEDSLHRLFRLLLSPAFYHRTQAVQTLGGTGDGWTECFDLGGE